MNQTLNGSNNSKNNNHYTLLTKTVFVKILPVLVMILPVIVFLR
jgi:hypothetical protein